MFEDEARLEEERKWIAACRTGNRKAFAKIYHRFAGEIFASIILPRVGNRAVAEDLLLETFRTVWEQLHTYNDRGKSIFFWIARIAANKTYDQLRVDRRFRRWATDVTAMWSSGHAALEQTDADLGAMDLLQRKELSAQVRETLQQLSPRYREAIRLRFLECKSRQDCAHDLAISLGTFDVLLLRALRSFRDLWVVRNQPTE
ncbi:MAG: sigma-70 family RNA polymerase sigma factor [Myxococcales bacterium]|nr:sigma-70 family RNA polymerase sigma factor [Myxococcales bacterium]